MRAQQWGLVVVLASGIAALPAVAQGQESGRGYPAGEWPLVGGDWSSSRHSTLADIDRGTVDRLGGAWVTRLGGGASSRATPVV
ncbi:MAG: pyrrolo-quinoline quinone, partial [Acidobacteria bacterium]|nr:pyrrolo-quinoline quinone [Acidobacteriota bacterium]